MKEDQITQIPNFKPVKFKAFVSANANSSVVKVVNNGRSDHSIHINHTR